MQYIVFCFSSYLAIQLTWRIFTEFYWSQVTFNVTETGRLKYISSHSFSSYVISHNKAFHNIIRLLRHFTLFGQENTVITQSFPTFILFSNMRQKWLKSYKEKKRIVQKLLKSQEEREW